MRLGASAGHKLTRLDANTFEDLRTLGAAQSLGTIRSLARFSSASRIAAWHFRAPGGDAGREGTPSWGADPGRATVVNLRASTTVPQHDSGHVRPARDVAAAPLRKLPRGDGRCPARTGDLLLVRREQLLRSTAVCRSSGSTSARARLAAVVCCGLPLPDRFHKARPRGHSCAPLSRECRSRRGRRMHVVRRTLLACLRHRSTRAVRSRGSTRAG